MTVTTLYSSLLSSRPLQVAESANGYFSFCERHLQALWFDQKYFKNLRTSEGLPITVISPGLWNAEAGPDFKKAHLYIGAQEVRGDVELHLSEDGWQQHRHHQDIRYNDVVLHLSLWKPKKSSVVSTLDGRQPFRAHMEPFFTIPTSRIVKLTDLDLYPYRAVSGSGRCSHQLFRKLSHPSLMTFFKQAAEWRFIQKLIFLRAHSEDADHCFSTGIAMALGYKKNTQNFLDLYSILKAHRKLTEKELSSFALGTCGFFADHYKKKWANSSCYQDLLTIFETVPFLGTRHIPLALHQIRPFNHPIRRIVYMIQMLKDPNKGRLSGELLKVWEHCWPKVKGSKGWRALREVFKEKIPKYRHSYWNHHLSFGSQESSKHLPLLGGGILQEILVNIFLPILFGKVCERDDPKEMEAFHHFYASFPAGGASKSKYLKQRFFGDSPKGDVIKTAQMEQGAYQLHHDFCIQYEASCEGCPFVDRYKSKGRICCG